MPKKSISFTKAIGCLTAFSVIVSVVVLMSVTIYMIATSPGANVTMNTDSSRARSRVNTRTHGLGAQKISSSNTNEHRASQLKDMIKQSKKLREDVYKYEHNGPHPSSKQNGSKSKVSAIIMLLKNDTLAKVSKSSAPGKKASAAEVKPKVSKVTSKNCRPGLNAILSVDAPLNFMINAENHDSLSAEFVYSSVQSGVDQWNSLSSYNVIGHQVPWSGSHNTQPNGKNEIYFADSGTDGTLAYTIIWYIDDPNPKRRFILEADILIDDVNHAFGDARKNSNVYDLLHIITHELGHFLGLDDVYTEGCSLFSIMFGYSSKGQYTPIGPLDADADSFYSLYPQPDSFDIPNVPESSDGHAIHSASLVASSWLALYMLS